MSYDSAPKETNTCLSSSRSCSCSRSCGSRDGREERQERGDSGEKERRHQRGELEHNEPERWPQSGMAQRTCLHYDYDGRQESTSSSQNQGRKQVRQWAKHMKAGSVNDGMCASTPSPPLHLLVVDVYVAVDARRRHRRRRWSAVPDPPDNPLVSAASRYHTPTQSPVPHLLSITCCPSSQLLLHPRPSSQATDNGGSADRLRRRLY